MNIEQQICEAWHRLTKETIDKPAFLPQSGSYRKYYRLETGKKTIIGVYNEDLKENKAFLDFTHHFLKHKLPVPNILGVDPDQKIYFLEDLGDETLFSFLQKNRSEGVLPVSVKQAYRRVLELLPLFQVKAGNELDYSACYPRPAFDRQSMHWDLNYFKYYFLKLAGIPFDEQKLEDDFLNFIAYLSEAGTEHFMYRDFQSRNIMLVNGNPYFIDYQGGRRGAIQYDLASLLYDAKADLPPDVRDELLEHYISALGKHIPLNRARFLSIFPGFVLIRILQALGAYGFRGYYEKKTHFLQSVPYALRNLQYVMSNYQLPITIPTLIGIIERMTGAELFKDFKSVQSNLTVSIYSFSYRKAIPEDPSGNGGGFVFDCRALPNPGKFEEYQHLTGQDQPVIDFLKKEKVVEAFLLGVFQLVDQSVTRYIQRDFSHLMVSFGCTGGQHRSVFCAEALRRHLLEKFSITLSVHHHEISDKKSE